MYSLQLFNTSLSKQNSVIVGGVIGKQCISCSCVQSENVEYSNLRMFLPRVMDFKLLHQQNEYPSIYSISLLTVTDVSFVQLSNAEYPKYLILLDISYVNICNPAGKRIKVVSFLSKRMPCMDLQ